MKTYCIDTNVLLNDDGALFAFEENDVVIPMTVLEELDKHKTRQDEIGACARATNRTLDDLRSQGSLLSGIKLPKGGTLRVVSLDPSVISQMPIELQKPSNDNLIIATARQLTYQGYENVVLVSKDINVRIKCDACGIVSQDYRRLRANVDGEIYTGVEVLQVSDDIMARFFEQGYLLTHDLGLKSDYPNQIVVLKNNLNPGVLTRVHEYKNDEEPHTRRLELIKGQTDVFGLKPLNKEQVFSFELLCDPRVKLVTLSGPAGCVAPETPVTIKLSNVRWEMPAPADIYMNDCNKDKPENKID